MTAIVIALGIAVLFQFILTRIKWSRGLYADVFVDISMLLVLNAIFGGTILGVISATAGSTFISLYLLYQPIKLLGTPSVSQAFSPEAKTKLHRDLVQLFE